MAKLLRTEKTSWDGNKYVYACDICGAEVWYWHNRPNQNKICCKCAKERDKKKAQERAIAHDKQIRADAIDECIKFIKNHSTRAFIDSDGWGCSDYDREEIFKMFWLDDMEQLKEKNK